MTDTQSLDLPPALEGAVSALLATACHRNLRLATAESCTGGLLASILTDVEGYGHAFDRGFVVYTDAAKADLLGLDRAFIAREGAVSRPVAVAMADGAIDRSDADAAVAVTGFAGPGAPGEEEGLVHFAAARRSGATIHRECHFGPIGRGPVRLKCLEAAVEMLGEVLA